MESDIALGPRGRRQAASVAQVVMGFQPEVLYSSAMRRAVETAEAIASACELVLRIEPDLHERKMGPLSGQDREAGLATFNEAKRRWAAGDLEHTHEGGESYADVRRRVLPVWQRIVDGSPGRTVVVVAHGVVIRVLLTTVLPDMSPADFGRVAIDNVALNDLEYDGVSWTATALNQRVVEEFEDFAW